MKEEIERKYFFEKFDFEPFGDEFRKTKDSHYEKKLQQLEQKRQEEAAALEQKKQENAEDEARQSRERLSDESDYNKESEGDQRDEV